MPDISVVADEGMVGAGRTVTLTFRARTAYYDGGVLVKPRNHDLTLTPNVAKTIELRPGPWQVSNINQHPIYFDVGDVDATLKELIEAGLSIPPTAPAATLSEAVAAWMSANVNTEVTDTLMTELLGDPDSDAVAAVDARVAVGTAGFLTEAVASENYVRSVNGVPVDPATGDVEVAAGLSGSQIFLDTDGVPYFDPSTSGGVTLLWDDDGVPYFRPDPTTRTDTDGVPYIQIGA